MTTIPTNALDALREHFPLVLLMNASYVPLEVILGTTGHLLANFVILAPFRHPDRKPVFSVLLAPIPLWDLLLALLFRSVRLEFCFPCDDNQQIPPIEFASNLFFFCACFKQ